MSVAPYPGFALPEPHPFAGREAWRCDACFGFFYPDERPESCPYCDELEPGEQALVLARELQRVHGRLVAITTRLAELEVGRPKRRRRARVDLVLDLDCEIGKIRDTLCVHGHPDPGERKDSFLAALEQPGGVPWDG